MSTATHQTGPNRLARGTILAAATLTIMAPAAIAPSLPAMEQAFADRPGASLLVRLTMTVTSLTIAAGAPISGLLVDRFGPRPLLLFSLVLYSVVGTAGYLMAELWPLLVSRALLGIAVGGVMTAVSATIADWFDGPERASFLGLQQAAASLGGVVFLPLAGLLATFHWRAPFWLYGLAAVVALLVIFAVHDRPRTNTPEMDIGPRPPVLARVLGIYVLALSVTLVFYMAPTQIPFLLADLRVGPTLVGLVIAGSTVSSAIGGLAFPVLRRHLSSTAIIKVSIALLGVGWLLVGATGTALGTTMGLLIGGLGLGFSVPTLTLRLAELAPPAWRGRVLSGLVAGVFFGQFISPLVAQPVIQAVGIVDSFTWSGIALLTGAIGAALVSSRPRVRRTPERDRPLPDVHHPRPPGDAPATEHVDTVVPQHDLKKEQP